MTGPSFRFRLERVRALRERKEKLARQELARSLTRLDGTREQLRDAETELQRAQAGQRDAAGAPGTIDAGELQSRQAFLERVERKRSQRELDVSRGEAEVASRNAELALAAGEHEMLERLRARRRAEHERDAARRESKVLDEIAASRAGRSVA